MQTSCNYLHKVNLKFQKNRSDGDGTQVIEALYALFLLDKRILQLLKSTMLLGK